MMSAKSRAIAMVRAQRMVSGKHRRRGPTPKQKRPLLIIKEYQAALMGLLSPTAIREAFAPLLSALPNILSDEKTARGDSCATNGVTAPIAPLHLDKVIQRKGKWFVLSKEGDKTLGGPYATEAEALHRLGQIEYFKTHHMDSDFTRKLIEEAKARLQARINVNAIKELATKFAQHTSTFQRIQLNRQTKAALGVDLFTGDRGIPARISGFVSENVALIKSIPEEVASRVEKKIARAVNSGQLHGDLAKDLENDFGFPETRAKLIARDQVGKLYGQINASRSQEVGATQFIWRTVGDERVRDDHSDFDGETYAYDDPPNGTLPGEEINCRCSAEPVFDDIVDATEDVSAD